MSLTSTGRPNLGPSPGSGIVSCSCSGSGEWS